MSPFVVILYPDGRPVQPEELHRMLDPIAYAGPGGRSVWTEGPFGAGCLYPSGTARDQVGQQPVASDCGRYTLVADVRLDRRDNLRQALGFAGSEYQDFTDPQLLLAAWQRWAGECGRWLYGDFSFIVYDRLAQSISGVTDFPGSRRLFHARLRSGAAMVASHEACLMVHDDVLAVGWAEIPLGAWLRGCPQRNRSIFSQITVAACGEVFALRGAKMTIRKWWSSDLIKPIRMRDLSDYADAYRQLLTVVVQDRLASCHSSAVCELSGGMDSSSVAAAVRLATAAQDRSHTAVSFTYPGFASCDDSHVMEASRQALGFGDAIVVDAFTLLREQFRLGIGPRAESPGAFSDPLQGVVIDAARRRGSESIMVGFGGDELTRGRLLWSLVERVARGDRSALTEVLSASKLLNQPFLSLLYRELLKPLGRTLLGGYLVDRLTRNRNWTLPCFAHIGDAPNLARGLAQSFRDAANSSGGNRRQRQIVQELHFTPSWFAMDAYDLNAAPYGIAVHAPLLDRRIVEFALATPADIWFRDGWTKFIVRRAFSNDLPPEATGAVRKVMVDEPTAQLWASHIDWAAGVLCNAAQLPSASQLATLFTHLAEQLRSSTSAGTAGAPCTWFGTFLALWLLRYTNHPVDETSSSIR